MSADDRPASGGTSAFEVRLLGPVQVVRSGREVGLGGPPPGAADLLRLLGAVLFEGGDLDRADTVLSDGSQVAAAAGVSAVQARVRVLRADIRNLRGTGNAEALAECEAAAAVAESEGDLDGLAEALTAAGRLRFWLDDIPAGQVVLERAIACAAQRQSPRADAGQPLAGRHLSRAVYPG